MSWIFSISHFWMNVIIYMEKRVTVEQQPRCSCSNRKLIIRISDLLNAVEYLFHNGELDASLAETLAQYLAHGGAGGQDAVQRWQLRLVQSEAHGGLGDHFGRLSVKGV